LIGEAAVPLVLADQIFVLVE